MEDTKLVKLQMEAKNRHLKIVIPDKPKREYIKHNVSRREIGVLEASKPNFHKLRITVMRHFNFYELQSQNN